MYCSIGRTNTVAPPTSTSTGYGTYESAFPPIGETGATNCSLDLQLSLIIWRARSTRISSVPIIKVVLPDFRNPPVLASLVALKLLSTSAFDNRLLSWSCTTAMISFIRTTLSFLSHSSFVVSYIITGNRVPYIRNGREGYIFILG
jgi:hypothetical protein